MKLLENDVTTKKDVGINVIVIYANHYNFHFCKLM